MIMKNNFRLAYILLFATAFSIIITGLQYLAGSLSNNYLCTPFSNGKTHAINQVITSYISELIKLIISPIIPYPHKTLIIRKLLYLNEI